MAKLYCEGLCYEYGHTEMEIYEKYMEKYKRNEKSFTYMRVLLLMQFCMMKPSAYKCFVFTNKVQLVVKL